MPRKKDKSPQPRSWIVTVTCTVTKEIVCDDCNEDEAQDRPFSFSVDETETDLIDWNVVGVRPNT